MQRETIREEARQLVDRMVTRNMFEKDSGEYNLCLELALYGAILFAAKLMNMPVKELPYEIKEFLEDESI